MNTKSFKQHTEKYEPPFLLMEIKKFDAHDGILGNKSVFLL